MPYRIGTSHFVSLQKAIDYYRDYGYGSPAELERAVKAKVTDGEIHIGQPEIKPGETLSITDDGARYAISRAE